MSATLPLRNRSWRFGLVVGVALAMLSGAARAQVVIDMPPPRRKELPPAEVVVSPVAPSAAAAAAAAPGMPLLVSVPREDAGELALYRYARARRGTYDTYFNDGYHAGIRVYSYPRYYPQFVWGPFFPFLHFPHCW